MWSQCDLIVMSSQNAPISDVDFATSIEASLAPRGLKILVHEKFQDQLRNKGFGELENSEYILQPYEALYLLHTKRLVLYSKGGNNIDFDSLIAMTLKHDKDILTRFLIYRDLRSRGYVAKEGFGFGVDFRVYERGEFEQKPAKYVIFGINEGSDIQASVFAKAIEEIGTMGKLAVVAVIERRGEIIYYKVTRLRFVGNNKSGPNQVPFLATKG
jgi:tRNA-intron endonuclease, archaea type